MTHEAMLLLDVLVTSKCTGQVNGMPQQAPGRLLQLDQWFLLWLHAQTKASPKIVKICKERTLLQQESHR